MGIYSIIGIIVFGIYTILEIYLFIVDKEKKRTNLIQILGTIWTLWFAIYAIEQSNDSVKESRKQIDAQLSILNNQLAVQVEPILKVNVISTPTNKQYFKDYTLQLINDGSNIIYDIGVTKRELILDKSKNIELFGGGEPNKYNYEVTELDLQKEYDIPITKEDIDWTNNDRKFQLQTNTKNIYDLMCVYIYKIHYKRAIDRKDYVITKYLHLDFYNGEDEIPVIKDMDTEIEGKKYINIIKKADVFDY